MSTLTNIERTVTSLPPSQQRSLLVWLQAALAPSPVPTAKPRAVREAWLQSLAERRERGRTGKTGTPLQQVMDDLRGD
ncbi:MAG: hypothetical protein NTW21_38830 [Verrucomicrobia bacterium]|nr:hypothetical protein [Verrucomicrobiota bacterium]